MIYTYIYINQILAWSVFSFESDTHLQPTTHSIDLLPLQEDINITLDDDVLTIAATRAEEHDENMTNYHVKVRFV